MAVVSLTLFSFEGMRKRDCHADARNDPRKRDGTSRNYSFVIARKHDEAISVITKYLLKNTAYCDNIAIPDVP